MDRLTVYFTSDTHGFLFPTSFADETPRPMGLFSMDFPKDGNTLVIDGGDCLQGSPLTYFCHQEKRPMPVARAMNELSYDYVTLGNHDFNYGYETLRAHLRELGADCLCANLTDLGGELEFGNTAVRVLSNGLRVGLVGVVTSWVGVWEKPENMEKLGVGDPFSAAKKACDALRGQVDVLIGIYHGGLEKDPNTGRRLSNTDENIACRLCEELPFDLLLTGHQHAPMANLDYCGTHIVQPPCNATQFVKVTLGPDGKFSSALFAPAAPAALKPWQAELFSDLNLWLDRPIGRVSRALLPGGKLEMALSGSPIADFYNMVQLDASGADVSCSCLGNELRGLIQTDVTVRDVVASYTYSNTLVVLEVTGEILRLALEQCATYFDAEGGAVRIAENFLLPKEAHYNYDFFYGIEYEFDLHGPVGRRVTKLERNGKSVSAQDRMTLVMNNYRATGAGDFDFYKGLPRAREIQTEVSELILNYLSARGMVEIPDKPPYRVICP
jgi:2',3'-cyclic-nucleotide 2'-phosphodiesterase/3'-nucleotidase